MSGDRLWSLAIALLALVGIAAGVGAWARLGQARAVVTATLRACVQLAVVGAVIGLVVRTPALAPLYLAVMLGAATWTSGRRLGHVTPALAAISAGAGVSAAAIFAARALPLDAAVVVPMVAQLVGGSMTATTLSGQRLLDDVAGSWPEVEGWLALGATPAQAVTPLARRAAARALIPALDQTRNVGLVVLPGAFVGLLLGGATPLEAGRVQLLVLAGLLAAETVAAVVTTTLLSRTLATTKPATPKQ